MVDRRIERSIKQQLRQSGFTEDLVDPDFRVSFRTMTNTRNDYTEFPTGIRGGSVSYGYYGSYLDVSEFEAGTYVVEIIDESSGELVWRGNYRKRLRTEAPNGAEIQAIFADLLPPEQD